MDDIKLLNRVSITISSKKFEGIINYIDRKYNETERFWIQYELEKYLSDAKCHKCDGFRLNDQALAVKIAGYHIGEITIKSIDDCLNWFKTFSKSCLNLLSLCFIHFMFFYR